MVKSEQSKKSLEEVPELYRQAELTYNTEKDIISEKDEKLIAKIKEVYKLEDSDFKITSMVQFIFAKRFRTITDDLKINGNNVKEILGITKETFSRYRTGAVFPDMNSILNLAKELQTSPQYLLGLSRYTIIEAEEIKRLIGLSEKSTEILLNLKQDFDNQKVNKLEFLNLFIEDEANFLKTLNCLEQYSNLKEKAMKNENNCREDIKKQLLGLKGELISILLEFLKDMK